MDSRHGRKDWIEDHCGCRKNKRLNTLVIWSVNTRSSGQFDWRCSVQPSHCAIGVDPGVQGDWSPIMKHGNANVDVPAPQFLIDMCICGYGIVV